MTDDVELGAFLEMLGKAIKENWVLIIMLILIFLLYLIYQKDINACNNYYQEIIKNCVTINQRA